MARVAGLTPTERLGTGAVDRADSRAQTPDSRPAPGLSPTAAPVSIYSHPEDNTAAAGSDLRQLAAALGTLNPALNNYAATMTDESRSQQEAAAANKIGGMTFDEAQKGVQDGSISELQNPWFKAAFMKQFGQRVALKKAEELTDQYSNKFNKDGGDVEGLIAGTAKPVLDQYGNDKHFSSGFNGVFTGAAAKIRNEQAGYQSQRVSTEVRQGVYEVGTGIISKGMDAGRSAEEIVAQVRSTYAGNKQLLNVPYAEQDAEVFRMAETLTKGISTAKNPQLQKDVVEQLLNSARVAPDGKDLGALAQNRIYSSKAVTLLDAADKEVRQANQRTSFDQHASWDELATNGQIGEAQFEQLKKEHKENPGRYTDPQVLALKHRSDAVIEERRKEVSALEEKQRNRQLADAQHQAVINDASSLSGQGSLWAVRDTKVTDEHGNEKTLTADKVRGEVVDNFLRRSKMVAAQRHETPAQSFDREVGWFGNNGEENPQWSSLLKRGYVQGNASNLSGTKLPQSLEAASELYNQLYAKNPQLLAKHVDDAGMNFYEAMRFGTQVAGFDKRTAAINAMEINKDPTKYDSPSWKQKFDDVSAAVKKTVQGTFLNGAPDNAGEIAPQIELAAKFFAKLGAPPTVAVEEAKKRIAANYVDVNNYLVHTGDRAVPATFPDIAKRYIEDYAKKYGEKEGVTASDLTVQSTGNAAGEWRIVLKKSPGMIVNHPDGIFNLPKLHEFEQNRLEEERAKAVERANQKRDLSQGERAASMKALGLTENSRKATGDNIPGAVEALGPKLRAGAMSVLGLSEKSLKPDDKPLPAGAWDGTARVLTDVKNAF